MHDVQVTSEDIAALRVALENDDLPAADLLRSIVDALDDTAAARRAFTGIWVILLTPGDEPVQDEPEPVEDEPLKETFGAAFVAGTPTSHGVKVTLSKVGR